MLRVAVTVEQLWQPVPGGSGTYVSQLSRALADLGGVELVGVAAKHPPGGSSDLPFPVRAVRMRREVLYASWAFARAPRVERVCGQVDVVHATTWAVPGRRAPLVVTVHDLAFRRDPAHFTRWGNVSFRRALQVVRDEATAVIVPSQATASDCRDAGIDADRLVVVPHGVRAEEVTAAQLAGWRARYGVDGPYVLWCGTLEPRKNVERLVAAFAAARAEGLDAALVLVGPDGWGGAAARVSAALDRLPVGSVKMLGRLSEHDLQVAYAGAAAFAFPSLWEGFGMPVLEAMAHGVPVVTSRGTAMAEFASGCGALVDPRSTDSIAGGLLAAIVGTDRVAVAGRAAGFSWERSAAAHARVYAEAGRGR